MIPQDFCQSGMKQVGGTMILCDSILAVHIDDCFHGLFRIIRQTIYHMNDQLIVLPGIKYLALFPAGSNQPACVTYLTTPFRVKWSFIEYYLVNFFISSLYCPHSHDLCLLYHVLIISLKMGSFFITDYRPVPHFLRGILPSPTFLSF